MSETHLQATVGPDNNNPGAGSSGAVRRGPEGGVYSSPITARYQAAVLRGNVYGVANQTGVTSQAGLSATTPVLTLYNPADSGVNLVLWYASAIFMVAFAATSEVWLAASTDATAAAVTGTATTTDRNMLIGSSGNQKASPLLAATLPAAPIALSQLGVGLTGAITTAPVANAVERWYDGGIILKPNTAVSIQTGTASGAIATLCEYIWEEVAV